MGGLAGDNAAEASGGEGAAAGGRGGGVELVFLCRRRYDEETLFVCVCVVCVYSIIGIYLYIYYIMMLGMIICLYIHYIFIQS